MGIKQLLPFVSSIIHKSSIDKFKNKKAAIDGYALLHRIATRNPRQIVLNNDYSFIVNGMLEYLKFFNTHKIIPIFVFDGATLPSKKGVEEERLNRRKSAYSNALKYEKEGKQIEALVCWKQAIDITPFHASKVINAFHKRGVQCIVAPYEADAQMAYLSRTGYVDVVICEDSDMIPYGCSVVLFKLNVVSNTCDVYQAQDLPKTPFGINITLFQLQITCILSGCDYFQGVNGIGLKKALKIVGSCKTIKQVILSLKKNYNKQLPNNLEEQLNDALFTFNHQYIYDIEEKTIIPLTDFEGNETTELIERTLGKKLDQGSVIQIAEGKIDPNTLEPFKNNEIDIFDLEPIPEIKQFQTPQKSPKWCVDDILKKVHPQNEENEDSNELVSGEEESKLDSQPISEIKIEEPQSTVQRKDDFHEETEIKSNIIDNDPFEPENSFIFIQEDLTSLKRVRYEENNDNKLTELSTFSNKTPSDIEQPLSKRKFE
ncbi:exonuclease, putative [Entamoeba nuttalli P19]|uniref:Exonuclease 1 n=1 Tax=Entamoeba nuttalli (strain P19) TaxID=1076696 RepID=K2H284_ENTNP|nr:exonuclease, putative [Entamoeba nuttalli P19]EKE40417.1 exonuclease, putative [Entamoeba nuttalli P19]|eukprot:XP_008857245.1 exonuclease, putative [Entamoeba nuttalli P19]